jgi:X-Pro dipeptidyl-peptidase
VADPNRLAYLTPALAQPARISGTPKIALHASVDNRTAANLTALLVDYGPRGSTGVPKIVTRGWMDVQNRLSPSLSQPVLKGWPYEFRWDTEPKDYIFAAGHRIGLVVISTDYDYTLRPKPGTRISVHPTFSRVVLPIVGGSSGLRF